MLPPVDRPALVEAMSRQCLNEHHLLVLVVEEASKISVINDLLSFLELE